MILNHENPKHAEAQARLVEEPIIWLTTVAESGQPQSSPVWFHWDGSEFLIFGSRTGPKTRNVQSNPRVSLHLDGNGNGGGNVIFEGDALVDASGPPANEVPDYVTKYRERIESNGWTLESFARDYPHVIRVTPERARIW